MRTGRYLGEDTKNGILIGEAATEKQFAFVHIQTARDMLQLPDGISEVCILLPDGANLEQTAAELGTSLDYSWVWATKNIYGLVELYYNRLGEDDSASALANPAIVERLGRGELFTLGRYYLAAQIQAELHPLFNIFLTGITNLADRSVIVQPRAEWNFAQNLEVIFGAQLYAGETGSEFGGFAIPGTDFVYKSPDSVFAWVTWYF